MKLTDFDCKKVNKPSLFVVAVFGFLFGGCGKKNTQIYIEGTVVEIARSDMIDHYDDGRFEVFDASIIRVDKPARLKGTLIRVRTPAPIPIGSPLVDIESQVSFTIEEKDLKEPWLFSGSINSLRALSGR